MTITEESDCLWSMNNSHLLCHMTSEGVVLCNLQPHDSYFSYNSLLTSLVHLYVFRIDLLVFMYVHVGLFPCNGEVPS